MSITMDGVELGVAISEKAAEKIKYFASKEGLTVIGSELWRIGKLQGSLPISDNCHDCRRLGG